ncbi:tungstate transport system substrate-binding protein [Paucidesulfovibrio gracilis DSM 16080]|uniref:Tungstate transport system substrate-binding protein n=1 Tax=Paucidesulfovibrio gracilis DSM 16080 TaxID=1121449 RepID=A0A1T4WIY2_9BACT|nr:substrate-binding domain-containing protein [Paucidesulfovibrio gracilis]SKA76845.1 tungstate transport system substrate-binding protein [Paucidesulfovibrio gracilis DSM 16080]
MKHVRVLALMMILCLFAATAAQADSLMMATTTSTDNTGLLDYLAPKFQEDTGIELKWTAIGTGKALKMGQNCDVDVLLVHAPAAEQKFIDSGFGSERRQLMYNDFVIIGPASDPGKVKGMKVADALAALAESQTKFVSRGDDSGTNKKEISLWKAAGMAVPDKAAWYVQSGQGMIATIKMAEELGGYTMTDRGTYIKYSASNDGNPPLKVLVEGDEVLFNQYSVLLLDAKHCPDARHDLAATFAEWMASEKTQTDIADFRMLGQKLFIPNAD